MLYDIGRDIKTSQLFIAETAERLSCRDDLLQLKMAGQKGKINMDMNIQMPKGYKLMANHKNEVILAEAENKKVPEPYVTWLVSNGTDIYTGCYFTDLKRAELSFCERAFGVINSICDKGECIENLGTILKYNCSKEEIKIAQQLTQKSQLSATKPNAKLFQQRITHRGVRINNESYWNETIAMHHGETIQGIISNHKLLIFDKNGVNLGIFEVSTKL